jgi:hypothetical protein
VRQAAGQVARRAHGVMHLLLGLLILVMLVLAAGAWRLTKGPVELPFLARAIEDAANEDAEGANRLQVGRAAIAWDGWQEGRLTPVELRLYEVQLRDSRGAMRIELPDAAVTLSVPWLLRGELAPRVLELRGPELRLVRAADGAVTLTLERPGADPAAPPAETPAAAPVEELLAELMRPPSDETPRGALEALRITGGRVVVQDAALGRSWSLERGALDLRRMEGGGIAGRAAGRLQLGEASVPVLGTVEATGSPASIRFTVSLPEVAPAALARAAPAFAPLTFLDATVRGEVAGRLDADGVVRSVVVQLSAGPGRIDLGNGRRVEILGAEAALDHAPGQVRVTRAVLRLPGPQPVTLSATAEARLSAARWRGAVDLSLDALRFAELPRHWPEGVGSGERGWILQNITGGEARNGRWRFEGEVGAELDQPRLTALTGSVEVVDATVHWLRPIPPVERAQGRATFSLDEITVRVAGGRQQGTAVQARDVNLRFLFPDGQPPQADFAIPLAGPVPDLLTVLQHPRLKLFDRRPLGLKEPAGSFDGRLTLGFPLLDDLPAERLRVAAAARLREVRLADLVAGNALERGQFDVTVDNNGLRLSGTGTIAGVDARLGVEMDFRPGPPTQVVMRETAQARTDARNLAAFGLETEEVVQGPVSLDVRTERRRNGSGRVAIRGDLRDSTMEIGPLAWTKPPGQPGTAEATLRLGGESLEAVEAFRVEAPALSIRGNIGFGRATRLERVTITDGAIEASRFSGEVRPPGQPGAPWGVLLRGPVLDLRRALGEDQPQAAQPPPNGPPPRATYAIDARFDRVLLGPEREVAAVEARVGLDGRGVVREGRLAGRAGPRGAFEAVIAPQGAGRALRVGAEDAGALLTAFGVLRHLEGGRLSVQAAYAHNGPGAPLAGTAEMDGFSVRNAPGFAKLLQAMTLYGLVEAMSGPGLVFSRMVAPFALTPETLTLGEARAFSASLGLTAKGTLDRRRQRLAMEGTIVPAYFFNSLLGNMPIVGRLFAPETGGGLFAATWRVSGPVDDPQVSVNPLAALTPGFLRGLFGLGQGSPN